MIIFCKAFQCGWTFQCDFQCHILIVMKWYCSVCILLTCCTFLTCIGQHLNTSSNYVVIYSDQCKFCYRQGRVHMKEGERSSFTWIEWGTGAMLCPHLTFWWKYSRNLESWSWFWVSCFFFFIYFILFVYCIMCFL